MRCRCLPALIALAFCVGIDSPRAAQATKTGMPRALLGVPLGQEYRNADRELARRLGKALGIELEHDDRFNTYGDLIERVTTRKDQYLARMTPYAFVAAEMLGARLEVLATYESIATGSTTYRSYFVVNARRFQEFGFPATLDGVSGYLKKLEKPARFIYHDKFSTSSYLLPALWFRTHRIFATEQPASSVLRVEASQGSTSSSESVDKVASEQAELSAVWDGTKSRYEKDPRVLFIPLSLTLPNDLLVVPTSLDEQTKADIRNAIEVSGEVGIGDFRQWRNIDNAREALDALSELKRVARAAPAPVVVRVYADPANQDEEVAARLVTIAEDARQAIRLAGTELVLEEPKFHKSADVVWTVKWVHEGAILLVSEMQVSKEDFKKQLKQEFHISFTPAEGDLTTRIVSLIHSRMHRIRYIWPYQDKVPTVIRDVDFTIPEGEKVYVQRLTWRDPDRNDFVPGEEFDAVPAKISPATFAFDKGGFRTDTGTVDFQNPLSDVAYKVVLERRSNQSTLSKALAGAFIGLFLLAAAGAAFDLRRRLLPPPPPERTLPGVCRELASRLHVTWTERPLTEANVLVCNRKRVEEQFEELKSRGLVPASMGGITRWAYGFTAGTSLPFVKGVFSGEATKRVEVEVDHTTFGDALRLNELLDLMIRKQLLSAFVGRPLEWDALNELARTVLPGAEAGDLLIRPEDARVIKIASTHFRQVLDDGMKRLSLLRGSWAVSQRDGRCLAQQRLGLRGPILVGEARVSSVLIEFNIADKVKLPLDARSGTLDCWVLGKIVRPTIVDDAGASTLSLHLRVVALLFGEGSGLPLVTRLARDVDVLVPQEA